MERKYRAKQASDSLLVGCLLSVSGGLQDAYTYNVREQVFANAQTGNIVLMGQNLAMGNYMAALRHLLPLIAFSLGIYLAEVIHHHYHSKGITTHWRHGILLVETLVLALVAFLPQQVNWLANMLVSFVCALQVQSFRELEGNAYATTMCIGNLRSCMENLYYWHRTHDDKRRHKALVYGVVILFFMIGASVGGVVSRMWQEITILLCCPLLLVAFALMLRIRNRHLRFITLLTGAEEDAAIVNGAPDPRELPEK